MNNLVEYIKSKCENLDDMFFRKMDIKNIPRYPYLGQDCTLLNKHQ